MLVLRRYIRKQEQLGYSQLSFLRVSGVYLGANILVLLCLIGLLALWMFV
jgi:hypothetical protein